MGRASKFTDEQRLEVALDMLSGKMSVSEICRKWDIGTTYAYKLKDRAVELLRNGISKPAGRSSAEVERLRKKVVDLEQLAGDQALVIRYLKKKKDTSDCKEYLLKKNQFSAGVIPSKMQGQCKVRTCRL